MHDKKVVQVVPVSAAAVHPLGQNVGVIEPVGMEGVSSVELIFDEAVDSKQVENKGDRDKKSDSEINLVLSVSDLDVGKIYQYRYLLFNT